ncbi:hypothetical protein D3C81_1502470 [compost metagenome]
MQVARRTHRQPGHGNGCTGGDQCTGAGQQQGLFEGRPQFAGLPGLHTTGHQPAAQGQQRYPEGQDARHPDQAQGQPLAGAVQAYQPLYPCTARANPGVARLAAARGLQCQQQQATQGENASQHVGRRAVEGGLELIVDGGSEGIETDHRVEAVFGQKVQPDQQRTATDGQAQLWQYHPEKHCPRLEPERFGDIFHGRVEASQRRRNR